MLKEVDWPKNSTYRTGSSNEPIEFYLDGLTNSNRFDLLLGYFSSAAISILSLGFAKFLHSGGSLRMIVNDVLSESDRDVIKKAEDINMINITIDLQNIKKLKETLNDYGVHFFECIAWLIAKERIQIKIIKPKDGRGIAHYKSGVFSDGNDSVGFKASCNFTAFGLLENLEELDGFYSWEEGRPKKWIKHQTEYFNNIFSGHADFVDYIEIDQVRVAIREGFDNKDIDELIIQEEDLVNRKVKSLKIDSIQKRYRKLIDEINIISNKPKFPYPGGPRSYQSAALTSWLKNGRKGIFAMATGTGKTITSLNCLLHEYGSTDRYRALILVPTVALLTQWRRECEKFNFKNIVTVSSGTKWNDVMAFFTTASKITNPSFIVIATYASFRRNRFQKQFEQLPSDTLLIADELHNLGAKGLLKLLPKIHLDHRIGLSATPSRKYDLVGNVAIEEFFDDHTPYVFSFSMEEAMNCNPPALCKYTYYPHVVYLESDELDQYIEISIQLLRYFDSATQSYIDTPEVEMLLLRRKRIIHKARNKKHVFNKVIRDEFRKRGNLKYTLIYVPEGVNPDHFEIDEYIENEEESKLINEYTRMVSSVDHTIMVRKFISGSKNRDIILKDFEEGKTHVLTSMKCLDEGVDVPRSELAIFCASTGNPRQFIQRRGRVLRLHEDKIHAVIHDLVVVPNINVAESNFAMERNLIKKELERVVDFSQLAMNKIDTYEELKEILNRYNLNLNDLG